MHRSAPHLVLALLVVACSGAPAADPVDPAKPTLPPPAEGWGAVFHRGGVAVQVGGGGQLVGPRGVGEGSLGDAGACGGRVVTGGPEHPVLALPRGVTPAGAPEKPAANPAPVVEAAAWRVDEALPEPDRFTPRSPEEAQPARQRGVALGSVVKVRRYGGPPVLVASGTRDCNGLLAVLSSDAGERLATIEVPGGCAMGRVLPPADLDGDGTLETAYFSDDTVLLARLHLDEPSPRLETLGAWRCAP